MRPFLTAGVLLTLAAPAAADFTLDMTSAEIRSAAARPAVIDLAVGESGILDFAYLCSDGDGLYLYALSRLSQERSEYGVNYVVTREPDGRAALKVAAGAQAKVSPGESVLDVLITAVHVGCSTLSESSGDLLRITSINGLASATEVLKQGR